MRIEPKTFFANERTFLSWLHMAITVGSIAAALLGFAGTATKTKKTGEQVGARSGLIILLSGSSAEGLVPVSCCQEVQHAAVVYAGRTHCDRMTGTSLPCWHTPILGAESHVELRL